MMGNGIANIVAAIIIAAAIWWNGNNKCCDDNHNAQLDEAAVAEIYARAVGDIRNDIVVSCGDEGDGIAAPRRASADSF